jgi:hypothetical protein
MVPIEVELAHLKGSVGLILAKASAMRISIPHRPVYAALHTLYSFTCSLNEQFTINCHKTKTKKTVDAQSDEGNEQGSCANQV